MTGVSGAWQWVKYDTGRGAGSDAPATTDTINTTTGTFHLESNPNMRKF